VTKEEVLKAMKECLLEEDGTHMDEWWDTDRGIVAQGIYRLAEKLGIPTDSLDDLGNAP